MAIVRRNYKKGTCQIEYRCGGKRYRELVEATTDKEAHRLTDRAKTAKEAELAAIKKATRNSSASLNEIAVAFEEYFKGRTGRSLKDDLRRLPNDQRQIGEGLTIIASYLLNLTPPIHLLTQINQDVAVRLVQWRSAHYRWDRPECGLISASQVNRSTVQVLQRVFTHARKVWTLDLKDEPTWGGKDGCKLKEPKKRKRVLLDAEDGCFTQRGDGPGLRQAATVLSAVVLATD